MTTVLFVCPYGHEAECTLVEGSAPRGGLEHLVSTWGVMCNQCGRTFVNEVHRYPQYGGIDYLHVGNLTTNDIYEVDGPWTGNELTFKGVDNEPT